MIKINRRAVVILLTGLSCVIIAGCGKKKELDAASSKVLPITVAAPSNTPTPSVEQVDSAAVTTNGNPVSYTHLVFYRRRISECSKTRAGSNFLFRL